MNTLNIIDILERTQTGEYCTVKEWDTKRVPRTIREKLKKYRLDKSFDLENPVNTDFELADEFFKAGYEVALELGMLYETGDRIVKVSEEELAAALKYAPSEVIVGVGKDATLIRSRIPSDPYPMKFGAPLGITMSEDIFLRLNEAMAREREVDILTGGSLITIFGRTLLAGTPFETLAGYEQARLHREARRLAGRPGMGGVGCVSSVTEYGQLGSCGLPGGFPPTDLSLALFPSELKINDQTLHKVVQAINTGGMVFAGSPAMIGGMPGPPEGAALSSIAAALLQYPILQSTIGGGEIYDLRSLSSVNRDSLKALSITHQALSRNTHLITHGIANQVSGPGTENLLLESLVGMATLACSGSAFSQGPRSAGGKLTDHITPLETRFCGEIAHASSALSPEKVNEIAKEILPRYEEKIKEPDLGKPVQEVYDLKTLKPTKKWEEIYIKVRQEAIQLGIPLDAY
jgi:methylamine--corrinoid protein Co-methyltransferase